MRHLVRRYNIAGRRDGRRTERMDGEKFQNERESITEITFLLAYASVGPSARRLSGGGGNCACSLHACSCGLHAGGPVAITSQRQAAGWRLNQRSGESDAT